VKGRCAGVSFEPFYRGRTERMKRDRILSHSDFTRFVSCKIRVGGFGEWVYSFQILKNNPISRRGAEDAEIDPCFLAF
jgi:hypothetical protein